MTLPNAEHYDDGQRIGTVSEMIRKIGELRRQIKLREHVIWKAAEEHDAVYALGSGPIEQARQIPLPQFVATRFIRVDGADGHNEIVDRLNGRIAELESELTLSLRCDECGGLRTLHPSRNFYECLPCHQKRMEQQ